MQTGASKHVINGDGASYDTIGELSETLRAHDGCNCSIPTEFVLPESCRPNNLPYDARSSSGLQLPVFDFSEQYSGGRAAKLTEICEEWGFVQVINHGVSSIVLQEIASFGQSFFALPTEDKKRGALSYLNGYGAKQINFNGVGTPWVEGLTFITSPQSNVAAFEKRMWPDRPDGNPVLRHSLQQFEEALEKLEVSLLELLAEGLGVEKSYFSQHFDKSKGITTGVHFNYYPPCPDPSRVLGALPHTDPSCLTVLYQDKISGLQVQANDGSWHPVCHEKDGLLVFAGDILQGWSNGRFPAVVHRVVLNDKIPRLSFLHATSPPPNLVIQPAASDNTPARYKAFTYKGYMEFKNNLHLQRPDAAQRPIDAYSTALEAMSA